MVYIDQYTGEILKDDATIYFFYIMAHLHGSLLLNELGAWIVDVTTIVFFITLITGLVLWWPKEWNKKTRKAVFNIKWKANRKRLNYDLHKVGGFYALGICLLLTITGFIIAFKPLASATKEAFGGDGDLTIRTVFASEAGDSLGNVVPINQIVEKAFETFPEKTELQLYTYWLNEWDRYVMYVANKIGIKSAMNAKFVAYHKDSGRQANLAPEFITNMKVENTYWTLHMGNYMGIFGKIITFLSGLIATALPVTGFYIWRSKRKTHK